MNFIKALVLLALILNLIHCLQLARHLPAYTAGGAILKQGDYLTPNTWLASGNGYFLTFQKDGNLVLYKGEGPQILFGRPRPMVAAEFSWRCKTMGIWFSMIHTSMLFGHPIHSEREWRPSDWLCSPTGMLLSTMGIVDPLGVLEPLENDQRFVIYHLYSLYHNHSLFNVYG